jgi:branched-chain amino acid transport system permease protein
MDAFLHQLFSGLANGAVYASLALAVVMIYRSTHVVNFSQGEMAMFSTFFAWWMITSGVPYWVAFAITVVVSFFVGMAIERVIVRPVERASVLAMVTVCVAMLVIFNSVAGWIFTYSIRSFPSPFPSQPLFGNPYVSSHQLGMMLVTLLMLVLLYLFFRYTRIGLAMRAVAENPESSRLAGIRVGWMLAFGWGLAAAIGAVTGMMVAPILYLDPNMMLGVLIYALASALVGGIDNPFGAVIGGIMVGVVETLAGAYVVGTELRLSVALIIIVGVLLIKPTGMFGKTFITRV